MTLSHSSLSFSPGTWENAQTVTATAVADADTTKEMVTLTLDPAGANYDSAADETITVTVYDDDETTAPTLTEDFYSDATASSALTAGSTLKGGDDIYTQITFSEPVKYVASSTATARPQISFRVVSTTTQYAIVAQNAILTSGQCKPRTGRHATVYRCYYQVSGTDAFKTVVGTNTQDLAGNSLASTHTTSDTADLDAVYRPARAHRRHSHARRH